MQRRSNVFARRAATTYQLVEGHTICEHVMLPIAWEVDAVFDGPYDKTRIGSDVFSALGGTAWKRDQKAGESEQVIQGDVPPLLATSPVVPKEPPRPVFKEEAPRRIYVKT